jgi:hemerythrin
MSYAIPLNVRWSDELSVGHAGIDTEHRCFIEQLGRLGRVIPFAERWPETLSITEDMVDAVLGHFAHEEAILGHYGFPGLDAHALEHRRLTVEVDLICSRIARSLTYEARHELVIDLSHLLLAHLIDCDSRYRSYLIEAVAKEQRAREGRKS